MIPASQTETGVLLFFHPHKPFRSVHSGSSFSCCWRRIHSVAL